MTKTNEQEKFNIVGVVVNCNPQQQPSIQSQTDQMNGVEVHAGEQGKIVITIDEDECEDSLVDTVSKINTIPGVLATSIAYHHFEGKSHQTIQESANQEKPQ